ncbi:MAG: adenylate/guanylate cyclase domain-containing protein [Chloroflexi bacterium]|uniref:Adenylate/guanylate cyclase domain-containing protein n=1 Tax=Candidatus Chlorohelix allophototropha TaxID=3003348 RepID=A0A8T7M6L4_9CHLR|nr:adenylate/guanylate cyclase domain-containing protein [Chloroflexota bacterium]WJW69663.1 adenylate/guanylate cyclase domain-containing protein [Chloroflexota bacterium L227-S17]
MNSLDRASGVDFEKAFTHELLLSERRRLKIQMAMAAGLFIVLVVVFLLQGGLNLSDGVMGRFNEIFLLILGFILYELAAISVITYFIRQNRHFPKLLNYLNYFIEINVPNLVLALLISFNVNAQDALQGPHVFVSLILVFLTVLGMDFFLSVFIGTVAAIGYLLGIIYYLDQIPPFTDTTTFTALPMQLLRCFLFFLSGIIAGLLSRGLRQRFINSVQHLQERNQIVQMFGQYVSPEVVNRLLEQKTEIISEARFVCVMFLDIRNFTAFAENRSPQEVVEYLNTLFEFMIESVNRYNGIVNKFLGDGFMAVFGAPFSDEGDCENAVAASLEILQQITLLCQEGKIPPTRVGIGLHAGETVTGNVGSTNRKEYTIIGDAVNLASRIEQLNKQFGSQMLVSDVVWEKLNHMKLEAQVLEPVLVKGRQHPVQLYRLN